MPVPLAARFKAWVCGRSLAGIVGSNSAGGMVVCCECCVLSVIGLCRAGHSSRGVTPSVVLSRNPISGGHDLGSGRSAMVFSLGGGGNLKPPLPNPGWARAIF